MTLARTHVEQSTSCLRWFFYEIQGVSLGLTFTASLVGLFFQLFPAARLSVILDLISLIYPYSHAWDIYWVAKRAKGNFYAGHAFT